MNHVGLALLLIGLQINLLSMEHNFDMVSKTVLQHACTYLMGFKTTAVLWSTVDTFIGHVWGRHQPCLGVKHRKIAMFILWLSISYR